MAYISNKIRYKGQHYRYKIANITKRVFRRSALLLTLVSLAIYGVLIFEKLTTFPAYFFCDEAIVGVEAYSLITTGHDSFGKPWPVFFRGLGQYQQSLAVYLQIPFVWLFGLNETAVRLTNACISLLAAGAIYALIRVVYKLDSAWLTFAILAFSPLWFLHSRTGFECVPAVAFFLAFGLFYILAFTRHSLFVVPAAFCGAATFYTYTPARGWILITLVLLLLFNLPEHLRHWKTTLLGFALFVLLLSPYLYWQWNYPELAMSRLHALNFAGFKNQPLAQQAIRIIRNYASGLNPLSWYTWSGTQRITEGGERHLIPHLPALFVWTTPFMVLGFVIVLLKFRTFENRTLLALLLASPFAGALIHFNTVRGMPVGMLMLVLALLGIGWVFKWLQPWSQWQRAIRMLLVAGCVVYALWFRYYVYQVVPYAYNNYGFYGLQMGAPEVFHWIQTHHHAYEKILVAHDLFNGGEIFIPFYLRGDAAKKTLISDLARMYKDHTSPLADAVYIAPIKFYQKIQAMGCPIQKEVIMIIPDLKGRPLFEIITLQRGEGFEEWVRTQRQQHTQLQQSRLTIKDRVIAVEHPLFDLGNIAALFDGDPATLARTAEINPARIILHLPNVEIQRLAIMVSHTERDDIIVRAFSGEFMQNWGVKQYVKSGDDLGVITFDAPDGKMRVTALEIIIQVPHADQYEFVHINEIDWE